MIIKTCPFCGNQIFIGHDENGQYFYCKNCLENNIIIKVYGPSDEDIIQKWNKRKFDDEFLKDFNYIDAYRRYLQTFGTSESDYYDLENLNSDAMDSVSLISTATPNLSGCFIYPNGKLETVEDHHAALTQIIGVPKDVELPTSEEDICEKLNIIKVSFIYKYITAYVPEKVSRKQIEVLGDYCLKNSFWCEKFGVVKGERMEYTNNVIEFLEILKGF